MTLLKNDKEWHLQLQRDMKAGKRRLVFPKKGDCKVKTCNATTCENNEDNNCKLDNITVDNNGVCEQFKVN
jgi:hypothetical protein